METIQKYFPELTDNQIDQFTKLLPLYKEWNARINVVSRKDIESLYLHHVLHSLSIARVLSFNPGAKVIDVGTGGGFPGIPLAILFPETKFLLIDSIGKKIKVVDEISAAIDLNNIKTDHTRAENIVDKFDFVMSRAVTSLPVFTSWVRKIILKQNKHSIPNGILYLKGGDFAEDLESINYRYKLYPVSQFFHEDYFQSKFVIHLYR